MSGPTPRYDRNLVAVAAHFRRAGAHRDVRISMLEQVAEEEIAEWWEERESARDELLDAKS